ncbi:hypothetical protein N0V88_006564 [Collariella sp. IMI 366227]|nr:hypothetical protein N0V88_006564 [Collariella sp. IMI 366227]
MVHPDIALQALLKLTLTQAFAHPYLMDELLALSAAHKSTLLLPQDPNLVPPSISTSSAYLTASALLQTRALARLNQTLATTNLKDDDAEEDDGNCLALFLFSTFLAQHVLFDVFHRTNPHHNPPIQQQQEEDLSTVLDRFTHCLSLHRGIRAVAAQLQVAF